MYIQNLPFYIAVILKSNLFQKQNWKKMIGLKNVRLVIVIYDVCMHHPFFTLNKINLLFKRIRCIFSWPILHRYDCFARKVVEASINKCIQQGWNILLKIYMYFKNIWPIIRIRNIWVLRDIPVKCLRRTNCTFVLNRSWFFYFFCSPNSYLAK